MTFQAIGKSKFVISILAGYLTGTFLGDLIQLDLAWAVGLVIGLLISMIVWRREKLWSLAIICILGLVIGLGYFNFWDSRRQDIHLPYEQEIEFEGQVIGHPDFLSNQGRYVVKFQNQKIQVIYGRWPEYAYGDVLKIKGMLQKSNDYLFHQGVLGVIYNPQEMTKIGESGHLFYRIIYRIRDQFETVLNRSLSEPYASFAAGLVLGSKRNIPDSLMSDLNRTGTTHIIAVSGYNLTILIVYIGLFLGLFSRRLKFWGSLLVILAFVIMTGAPASVVRAGILAGLVALGHFEGRRINLTILLLLVASIMLILNPYVLKFDISFELSFLAFAGIVYLAPLISDLQIFKWLPKFIRSTLSETLAAQLMVLPILVYYFGRLSIVSPLVNLLVLWVIPLTMGLIFLVAILGMIWLSLGQIAGFLGFLFLKYIIIVIESFSGLSWASYEFQTSSWWWMIIFYAIISLVIYHCQIKFPKKDVFS